MSDQGINPPLAPAKPRGRPFAKGNPGKPRGTKSRANTLMDQLFTPNSDDLKVIRDRLISEAKCGEEWAVLAIINRMWPVPKGSLMQFPLPSIKTAADVALAQESLLQAVATGKITAVVAVELSGIVERLGRALADSEIEARLAALENLAAGRTTVRWTEPPRVALPAPFS